MMEDLKGLKGLVEKRSKEDRRWRGWKEAEGDLKLGKEARDVRGERLVSPQALRHASAQTRAEFQGCLVVWISLFPTFAPGH